MPGALNGVRVIDMTQMISGPVAARILGDQGADVIKVEAPGVGDLVRVMGSRDGFSATFATSNRNKRSIVLDMKKPEGLAWMKKLVASADVFLQNFRPGAVDRMGISEDALRAEKPDLIYVSISGFGESGPYAHKRVYDPVVQALSGFATIQEDRDTGRPRMMRLIVPDKLTALTAAQAITAALFSRERTGKGQHLRLAMLDAAVAFQWPEGMASHTWLGQGARRPQARLSQDLIFHTSDGYITCGAVSDAEWQGLCKALDQPQWLEDPRYKTPAGRMLHAGDRLAATQEVLATSSNDEWLARLEAEDVPCAPVLTRESLLEHPQVIENEIVVEGEHSVGGPMRQARPPERFSETPSEIRRQAPVLGEHTNEILSELGADASQISALRAAGAAA